MATPHEILEFWFGPDADQPLERAEKWFQPDDEFDREIRERFEDDVERAAAGEYDSWRQTPRGSLAYIILLDQFTRNIYRDSPKAFAHDSRTVEATLEGIERDFDEELEPVERAFFYMPLMHSEDPEVQETSLEMFDRLRKSAPEEDQRVKSTVQSNYDFAVKHAEIIDRFGRYPHRNEVLGRESTDEERAFLEERGRGF